MKPLPAPQAAASKASGSAIPSLPSALATPPGPPYSTANRRATANPAHRAYPLLLSTSTAVAALFCMMYITKPVIMPASSFPTTILSKHEPATLGNPSTPVSLMPSSDRLPGEKSPASPGGKPIPANPRRVLPTPPAAAAFEETNLRIQHILTAEAPGGHLDRIDIDVPVLYQSRNLRWTAAEVAEARKLLVRLMDYQEKSRGLRAEGMELQDSWNRLIGKSIPVTDLRADSPSLPANQEDGADSPNPAGLITTESIQIQPSGK